MTEELAGVSPTSLKEAKIPVARPSTSPEGGPSPQSPCEENLVTPVEPPTEVTPSESSESISLVTQIAKPPPASETPALPKDLSQKLLEASLEEQDLAVDTGETGPPPRAQSKPHTPACRPSGPEPRPPARVETLREEVLTDLRVFELNSDSGKSTPSNNGKKGKSRPKPREHVGAGQVRVATSQGRLVSLPLVRILGEMAFVCDTDNGDSYYRLSVCYCIPSIRTCILL